MDRKTNTYRIKTKSIKNGAGAAAYLENRTNPIEFENIKNIDDLQRLSQEVVWQNFERLTAFIFEMNDFSVETNIVKVFDKTRRQYDIIVRKYNKTFLIECKKWSVDRYRLSALKKAIEKHRERAELYQNSMNEEVIPVIVTLIEEEIKFYEGMPVVPILRLNSFIDELDGYSNEDFSNSINEFINSEDDLSKG